MDIHLDMYLHNHLGIICSWLCRFFYFSGARTSLKFLTESRKIVHASLGTELCLLVHGIRISKTAQLRKKQGQDSLSWAAVWFGGQVCWSEDWLLHVILGSTKTPISAFRLHQCVAGLTAALPPLALCSSWQPLSEMWTHSLLDDLFGFSAKRVFSALETTLVIKTFVKQNRVTGFVI